MSLSTVDAFQKLIGVSLFLEVYQVFVISVNSHIGVGTPSPLNLFSSQLVFCFKLHLFLPFQVSPPSPLDLDCSDVVHCESVVLKQTASQGHFVCRLDQGSTEVAQTLVLILVHHIEWRGQKLLTKVLSCS